MKKTTGWSILWIGIALATASAPLSAADRIRVGQWEVTTTNNGRTRTFKRCVSAVEAAAINGDAKAYRAYYENEVPNCRFTEYKQDGNLISSVMTCGSITVSSVTTYHGDSYVSDAKSKTGAGPDAVAHGTGKRLGDCP